MKVRDHKKFCCFDYVSDNPAYHNHGYSLGDVVTKVSEDGTEIGVVIQLHEDGDLRTDMFGNASPSEVTMSTIEDIEKYRNDLLEDITSTPNAEDALRAKLISCMNKFDEVCKERDAILKEAKEFINTGKTQKERDDLHNSIFDFPGSLLFRARKKI